jgi:hypothetical protein
LKRLGTTTLLLATILIFALGCAAHSPTAPPFAESVTSGNVTQVPAPLSAPVVTSYHVSGFVTDENGSPVANAEVTLYYADSFKQVRTSTDAHGYYDLVFDSGANNYKGNIDVVGVIIYTGGGEFENYHAQAVPSGRTDIVQNLRLRRILTVNAGQSFPISIDPDSSVAYDGEDWLRMTSRWEKFHVRAADSGILTIAARAQAGGINPSLAVYCMYDRDNCRYSWVKPAMGSGVGSVNVQANSLFEIRLAIPTNSAPQRYEIATSLER